MEVWYFVGRKSDHRITLVGWWGKGATFYSARKHYLSLSLILSFSLSDESVLKLYLVSDWTGKIQTKQLIKPKHIHRQYSSDHRFEKVHLHKMVRYLSDQSVIPQQKQVTLFQSRVQINLDRTKYFRFGPFQQLGHPQYVENREEKEVYMYSDTSVDVIEMVVVIECFGYLLIRPLPVPNEHLGSVKQRTIQDMSHK